MEQDIGPFMLYVNSDADQRRSVRTHSPRPREAGKWPYNWVSGMDYPSPEQRASVKGQLVSDGPAVPTAKMSNVRVGVT